jgi:hypothetical protein
MPILALAAVNSHESEAVDNAPLVPGEGFPLLRSESVT